MEEKNVIVRLRKYGQRFELVCVREELRELQRLKSTDVGWTSAVVIPVIFSNASRGERMSNASVAVLFGVEDVNLVIWEILERGETVVSAKTTHARTGTGVASMIKGMIQAMVLHRFTGLPLENDELEDALTSHVRSRKNVLLGSPWELFVACVAIVSEPQFQHDAMCVRRCSQLLIDDLDAVQRSTMLKLIQTNSGVLLLPNDFSSSTRVKLLVDMYLMYHWQEVQCPWWPSLQELIQKAVPVVAVEEDVKLFCSASAICDSGGSTKEVVDVRHHPKRPPPATAATTHQTLLEKLQQRSTIELKEVCRKYGLSTAGKRLDLLERLETYEETSKPKTIQKKN